METADWLYLKKPRVCKILHYVDINTLPGLCYAYLSLTEFKGRTVSYGPSFFLLDLWPKREARGP